MENTRIGKLESIALILIIMVNNAILNVTKSIVSTAGSASLLNTIYISILALIISYIIYLLLNKFPTFDILDISNFLGGKFLKVFVACLFLGYFIFFSAALLKNFVYCLQVIYYPNTNTFFITMMFLIGATFVCNLKYNALYRSNLLIMPFIIFSVIVLFVGNFGNFVFENIFPVLGHSINTTFIAGISNLFAFQGLLQILFLPPCLKDVTELKKITLLSILFSGLYLIINIAIILFMFNYSINDTLLMPLYSAVTYIEFGKFFQRVDSIFILTWVISFVSYLSIIIKTCCTISKKTFHIKSTKFISIFVSFLILIVTFFAKTYATSTFWSDVVYRYAFFITLAISILILLISYFYKIVKIRTYNSKTLPINGGI